jgi:hypothetical protein
MLTSKEGMVMSCKKGYKNWNIKGIAESVIKEIEEDGEDLENVLDYYLQRTYWSIYSRDIRDVRIVSANGPLCRRPSGNALCL